MNKFTNPLDSVRIASPCSANWNEMYGNERKRFCSECKLNVYNLSEMTQGEAENFLINSEGRVCLRIFRRNDGTVLTQDCPVGWQAVKKKVSRAATAVFALIMGIFGGILSLESLKSLRALTNYKEVPEIFFKTDKKKSSDESKGKISFRGMLNNLPEIKAEIFKSRNR
ncbi:MAG: hypothetical protein M3R14_13175 [Acidobacteriota bacterium]|nr:hypothetical protein [Acidobacteriota bacterium]